jgi:hypothetical protein
MELDGFSFFHFRASGLEANPDAVRTIELKNGINSDHSIIIHHILRIAALRKFVSGITFLFYYFLCNLVQ